MIAVTFMIWDAERDDDGLSTAVVSASDGTLSHSYPLVRMLGGSYGSFPSRHLLTCEEEYPEEIERLFLADPGDGRHWLSPPMTGRVWGVIGNRYIHQVLEHEAPTADETVFYSTAPDGTDRRELLTITPRISLDRVHLAPRAFSEENAAR